MSLNSTANKINNWVNSHNAKHNYGFVPDEKKKLMADGSWNAMSQASRDAFNRKWAGAPPVPNGSKEGSLGGSSWGSGHTGGTGGGAAAAAAAERQARQQAAAAMRGRLENQWSRENEEMDALREKTLAGFGRDFDAQMDLLNKNFTESSDRLAEDRERAMADAYASKMAQERNAAQVLALAGSTGGLSESTIAGMSNEYGRRRNDLADMYGRKLGDLELARAAEEADAREKLEEKKRAYEMDYQERRRRQAQYYQNMLNDLALQGF